MHCVQTIFHYDKNLNVAFLPNPLEDSKGFVQMFSNKAVCGLMGNDKSYSDKPTLRHLTAHNWKLPESM